LLRREASISSPRLNKLLVVDDGADSIGDLIPADERIRLIRLLRRASVGAKRNLACEQASGTLIAHWDDDDWHALHRLRYQVDHLLSSGAAICGLKDLLFLDIRTGKAWQYNYPAGQRPWLSGDSLVYTRAFWAANRFPDIDVGEDSRFVWTAAPRQLIALSDPTFHVGIIHEKNVSPKKIGTARWKPHPVEDIQRLLGDDWNDFIPGAEDVISAADRASASTVTVVKGTSPTIAPVPTVRNVFACLVHESPECIVDLVQPATSGSRVGRADIQRQRQSPPSGVIAVVAVWRRGASVSPANGLGQAARLCARLHAFWP
jgi:Glycosyl transferase family 2